MHRWTVDDDFLSESVHGGFWRVFVRVWSECGFNDSLCFLQRVGFGQNQVKNDHSDSVRVFFRNIAYFTAIVSNRFLEVYSHLFYSYS